jgi:hypothetical protein
VEWARLGHVGSELVLIVVVVAALAFDFNKGPLCAGALIIGFIAMTKK